MSKFIQKIACFLFLVVLSTNQTILSGVNSVNINLNKNKDVILNYQNQTKEVKLKRLNDENYINQTFLGKNYKPVDAKIIRKNGNYIVKESKNSIAIDLDSAKNQSIIKDNINLKTKEIAANFQTEEAYALIENLKIIDNQNLQITIEDQLIYDAKFDILKLLKNNTDEVDMFTLYNLLNTYDLELSNLKSNLYVNFETGDARGFLKDGRKIDYTKTAENFIQNLKNNKYEIDVVFEIDKGYVIDENGKVIEFTHQGDGKSNYKGSDWGRSQNVKMGTENLINHVIVNPGEQISFLELLKNRGSNIRWQLAKVIKKGGELVLEPGGGLCQVSTTLFRAALQSGMQIDKWRNHSLYVSYYKAYNNGLDSTIYPPTVDLKFTNPYDFPVIFQSYTNDEKDVVVEIYASDKLPEVTLVGPFFKGDVEGLRYNQILWQRVISNGFTQNVEDYLSTYNTGVMR